MSVLSSRRRSMVRRPPPYRAAIRFTYSWTARSYVVTSCTAVPTASNTRRGSISSYSCTIRFRSPVWAATRCPNSASYTPSAVS